jgi:hypothetical protein
VTQEKIKPFQLYFNDLVAHYVNIFETTDHWIMLAGDGSSNHRGMSITIDSLDNALVSVSSSQISVAKIHTNGHIEWQRLLTGETNGVDVDDSDSAYTAGAVLGATEGPDDAMYLAKHDTDGTVLWQRYLDGTYLYGYLEGIAVDGSGNAYVVGRDADTNRSLYLAKYDTNGTIQWQRKLGDVGSEVKGGWGIATDTSSNVFVVGYTSAQGAGGDDIVLAKYDTNGTIQWQRVLGGIGNEVPSDVTTDSTGNVYLTGYTTSQGAGGLDLLVAKYDTNGTIQWQRVLGGAGAERGNGIFVDSSNNLHVTGYTTSQGVGSVDILIAKYDTNGTIQWQMILGGTGTSIGNGVSVDSTGNIWIAGYTDSAGPGVISLLTAKLPSDGSGSGTYVFNTTGTLVYQASTLTAATSTLTSATSTLSELAVNYTNTTIAGPSIVSSLETSIVGF